MEVPSVLVKTPVKVSPVELSKKTYYTAKDSVVHMRSYVKPKYKTFDSKRIYYYIDVKNPDTGGYEYLGRWEATLYNTDDYAYSTRAKRDVSIDALNIAENETTDFRVRVKLMWYDANDDLQVTKSTYSYFKVKD